MFEDYLQDANSFSELAEKATQEGEDRVARRYYRAAIFCTFSAVESFVNHVGKGFEEARNLSQFEVAFLNDRTVIFDSDKGQIREKIAYQRVEEKLKFLLRKFSPRFNFQCADWSRFLAFKKNRDALVHPRQTDDDIELSQYRQTLRDGISGAIGIMNSVSKGVFKKPLRKQLLDLLPD